jgi:anti-sigma regulatory factor (Ser/Thr protein kinase)
MARIQRAFEATDVAVTEARQLAQQTLAKVGLVSEDVLMVVNELAANAVSHVRQKFVLSLSTTPEQVTVEVRDPSPVEPTVREPTDWAVGGRGMLLVSALARRWGVKQIPDDGKCVWAVVGLTPCA